MQKFVNKLKKHVIFLSVVLITVYLIVISFYKYLNEYYFVPKKYYYEMVEKCNKDILDSDCELFENYHRKMVPEEALAKEDTVSLASNIVQNYDFAFLQFLGPLLIIIVSSYGIHKEMNSGMVKNYLTRMDYKSYMKRIFLSSVKYAWLFPLTLIIIFLIAGFVTNFNFIVDSSRLESVTYGNFKHSNYLLYTLLMCLLTFLHSIFQGNLGLICCKRNRNFVVSVITSYMLFMVVNIFSYLIVSGLFLSRFLNVRDTGEYFNLTGYWWFPDGINYIFLFGVTLLLVALSYAALYFTYRKKEGVLIENEKND